MRIGIIGAEGRLPPPPTRRPGPYRIRAAFLVPALLLLLTTAPSCAREPGSPGKEPPGAGSPPGKETFSLPLEARKWTGDLDGMRERKILRALVVPSKTFYFLDRGTPRGASYEALKAFEEELNRGRKRQDPGIRMIFIPVRRDQILPLLVEGKGDLAAANLTITPERERRVDFSEPVYRDASEVVVTGPASPELRTLDDLAGKEVFVRKSSSYFENLGRLNERFRREGKRPVVRKEAPEELEDEDLLEMLGSGLVPLLVVDRHKADFWAKVLPGIRVRPDLAVNTGGRIAWAFRKGSPRLKEAVDRFVRSHGQGTKFWGILAQRYLKSTKFVKNATSQAEMKKFRALVDLFRKYGDRYDFDWLLVMAQGYQESRLDHTVKSPAGAIGVMQVMPATGREMNVGDIRKLEPNVHAGVKYLRFMIDEYYRGEPMDRMNKGLFAFASYNAGPARIAQLRREAAREGLDPNVWFHNVERIAAKRIGRETVRYVGNIFKYYVAYRLVLEREAEREQARERVESK